MNTNAEQPSNFKIHAENPYITETKVEEVNVEIGKLEFQGTEE